MDAFERKEPGLTQPQPPRIVAIGLDGATLDLIGPWVKEGKLPTFREMMDTGSWGCLRSTIPALTPPAWTSAITGVNPGKHGIFDFKVPFAYRGGRGYETETTTSAHRRARAFWDMLNDAGWTTGIVGLPFTFPPEPLKGYLVPGPPGVGPGCWTYPPELEKEILRRFPGLALSLDWLRIRDRGRREFLRQLDGLLETHISLSEYLLEAHPADFFMSVFYFLDQMMHGMWRFMDSSHPDHDGSVPEFRDAVLEYHRKIDRWLGRLRGRLGAGVTFIVFSDHGHGPAHTDVYINSWLVQGGYMGLRRTKSRPRLTASDLYNLLRRYGVERMARYIPRRLRYLLPDSRYSSELRAVDWAGTRAYLFQGTSRSLNINLSGREPLGAVNPGEESERLVEELRDGLLELKDPMTGKPVIKEVLRSREVYRGDLASKAPDMYLVPTEGYQVRVGFHDEVVISKRRLRGDRVETDLNSGHRPDGILFMVGPGILPANRTEAKIEDVTPTILYLAGAPIPEGLDGALVEEAFDREYLRQHPVITVEGRIEKSQQLSTRLKPWEEAVVNERLRNLGYFD